MDEFMLSNLTFCRPGMVGGMGFGGVGSSKHNKKQGRNQNAMTLEGLTPIQPNWEDWGRFVADIYKLYDIFELQRSKKRLTTQRCLIIATLNNNNPSFVMSKNI